MTHIVAPKDIVKEARKRKSEGIPGSLFDICTDIKFERRLDNDPLFRALSLGMNNNKVVNKKGRRKKNDFLGFGL